MTKTIKKSFLCIMLLAAILSAVVLTGCGSSKITVTDLTGMTQAEAEAALTEQGLSLEVQRERFSKTTPKGSVDGMVTKVGDTVEKGDAVKVILSLGEGRTVPNLSVLTGAEAANLLTKVDLNPIIVEEPSDTVEKGNVISYTDAGQTIAKGSDVTVTVSSGPAI